MNSQLFKSNSIEPIEPGATIRTQGELLLPFFVEILIRVAVAIFFCFEMGAVQAADVTFSSARKLTGPTIRTPPTAVSEKGNLLVLNGSTLAKYSSAGQLLWTTNFFLPPIAGETDPTRMQFDADENIYLCGQTFKTYTTPPINRFEENNIPAEGAGGAYVGKLDPKGNLQWVRLSGESAFISPRVIAFDQDRNYLVSGEYWNEEARFGDKTLPPPPTPESRSLFIVKYSEQGQVLWARSGSNESLGIYVNAAVIDHSGNIIVAGGLCAETITFDELTLSRAGEFCGGFILKFSPAGTLLWAKSPDHEWSINSLLVDKEDNIITGWDTGLSKYSPAGDLLWDRPAILSVGSSVPTILAVDHEGNYFSAGAYAATGNTKGKISFGEVTLSTPSQWETYVTKYSSSGELLWAIQSVGKNPLAGGNIRRSLTFPSRLWVTPTGQVALAGTFQGTVQFGAVALSGRDYSSSYDVFLASIHDPAAVAPALNIRKVAEGIMVEWPTSISSYQLESTGSLSPPILWSLEASPSELAGLSAVRIQTPEAARFYRLRKQ